MTTDRRSTDHTRTATDPLMVMRRVAQQALALIPSAQGAAVAFFDDDLTHVCSAGNLASLGGEPPAHGILTRRPTNSPGTVRCNDAAQDNRPDHALWARIGVRSMLRLPLFDRRTDVGALILTSSQTHAFSDADLALLSRVTPFAAEAITTWVGLTRSVANMLSAGDQGDAAQYSSSAVPRQPDPIDEDRVAGFIENVMQPGVAEERAIRQQVETILRNGGMTIAFQPIIDLKTLGLAGCEALARFPGTPPRPPDAWFADAQRVGLGPELQLAAVEIALRRLPDLPAEAYLAINIGPDIAIIPELQTLLDSVDAQRIVVELTEHLQVHDYPRLVNAIQHIRDRGARLAIDDTGAGFAGLSHILNLAPDMIKLDRLLTSGIDADPARQALGAALIGFASRTRTKMIAEGIETPSELAAIRELGIAYGQGYLLGRPGPISNLPRPRIPPRVPQHHTPF